MNSASSKAFFHTVFVLLCVGFISFPGQASVEMIEDPTDGAWKDPNHPVVIELFTASNCAACMMTDRLLYDLAKEPNVIALSCHVHYWDQETLEDPTGLEACTYRQWAYRSSGRMSATRVKVPYIMLDGQENIDSARLDLFYKSLNRLRQKNTKKPLWIDMNWGGSDKVLVTLPQATEATKFNKKDSYSVWLIRYTDYLVQKVEDGDGNPRVLRFTNVVRKARHVAKWHGTSRTVEIEVPEPEGGSDRGGYVAIIHEINGSDIYAAGKLVDPAVKETTE